MRIMDVFAKRAITTSLVVSLAWAVVVQGAAIIALVAGVGIVVSAFPVDNLGTTISTASIGILLTLLGALFSIRYARVNFIIYARGRLKIAEETMRVDIAQIFLIGMVVLVLFPVVWIVSMSLDPRDLSRPQGLTLIPPGASIDAYREILTKPSPNPVSFLELLRNSLIVAGGTSIFSVLIGTSAAYAFSRLIFPGRRVGMLGFVVVLMIPPGGTLAPLFVLLNMLRIRTTLFGLMLAFTSTALPFAIWNMKGFIDSIPSDLEEAARIDGCSRPMAFIRVILPLALPGISVTALWGFLTGWSEFILSWTFLTDPKTFTLPMVLRGMIGQYSSGTPWAEFSAMAIVISIPPMVLFFLLQRYLVGGLSLGGVKG